MVQNRENNFRLKEKYLSLRQLNSHLDFLNFFQERLHKFMKIRT